MPRILFATGNAHKALEVAAILGSDWEVLTLAAYPGAVMPEETGTTFAENAALKAVSISTQIRDTWVLADDSGLEVDLLGGEPGVRSARYAGEGASDADNRAKLLRELGGRSSPARFRCALALAQDGAVHGEWSGAVHGTIGKVERGANGFGYDALFVPEGEIRTFAELPASVKNTASHRALALQAMCADPAPGTDSGSLRLPLTGL